MTALDRVREFFYPGSASLGVSPVDGTIQFYQIINQVLPENAVDSAVAIPILSESKNSAILSRR
jgi:hypothetical protein